jgi:putative membrane protein
MEETTQETSYMRDKMARIRTLLANERTLLAYARTSIMLAASGVTLIKLLYHQAGFRYLGFALVAASAIVMAVGYVRFRRVDSHIREPGSIDWP